MKQQLENIRLSSLEQIEKAATPAEIDEIRVRVLGKKGDEFCESFYIEQVNEMIDFGSTLSCSCKVRHSANDLPCTVTKENNMYKVTLSQPARSITPGQACVFYQGDRLLGGGTIVTR